CVPRCHSPSGVEAENRRVQRLGRTHGIEILTQEYDFAAGGTQEEQIVLTVDAPCRLDQALCPHLDGRALGIGKGVIPGVEEAEVFHRSEKPGDVAQHLSPSPRNEAAWRIPPPRPDSRAG